MTQPLRIEDPKHISFITTKTQNSKLWFVNNPKLEEAVLGYLAKYKQLYGVKIYSFVFQGNHYHLQASFPRMNRATFMRNFNSVFAKLVKRHVPNYEGGHLWARRYSSQSIVRDEDAEYWFHYTVLNPVYSGLAEKISEYPGYNSFRDCAAELGRTFRVMNWTRYYEKKRFNHEIKAKDFIEVYTLTYDRLPGNEAHSSVEYQELMHKKLEEKRIGIVKQRLKEGKGFLGYKALRKVKPGSLPQKTKTSSRHTHRPLILTLCKKTRNHFLQSYFTIRDAYTKAYLQLKTGLVNLGVAFPSNTYPPPQLATF